MNECVLFRGLPDGEALWKADAPEVYLALAKGKRRRKKKKKVKVKQKQMTTDITKARNGRLKLLRHYKKTR